MGLLLTLKHKRNYKVCTSTETHYCFIKDETIQLNNIYFPALLISVFMQLDRTFLLSKYIPLFLKP